MDSSPVRRLDLYRSVQAWVKVDTLITKMVKLRLTMIINKSDQSGKNSENSISKKETLAIRDQ